MDYSFGDYGMRMPYEMYRQLQGKARLEERRIENPGARATHNSGGLRPMNILSVAIIEP